MPRSNEDMPQAEVVLRLRSAIDVATRFPHQANEERALELARTHPQALRSAHAAANLGQSRWDWLANHGVTTAGEGTEIAGGDAIKETISPDYQG